MAAASVVHELVAEWVDRQPDTCAVCDPFTGEALSYRELWQRAGWLAADLIRRGVRPRDLVAVGQGRSVDLVVTFLGILRAGAAYLPLDGMAPTTRLAGILEESRTDLVVCSADRGSREGDRWLDLPPGARVVPVPRSAPPGDGPPAPLDVAAVDAAAGVAAVDVAVGVAADDPAYVAFTSGSTGRPKGVVVPHRAVVRLVVRPRFCTVEPGERVASAANPAFDATTFEIWNTLTAGGTVVVFPSVTDLAIDDWVALVHSERIGGMFLTTSLFHTVARERPGAFASLRTLVIGGEQLDLGAVKRVLAAEPPGRLVNGYGPTETTTFAAYYDCTDESLAGLDRIPIGYPLQETSLHLLDDGLGPVPPGEVGELCVGGPGVATGYLGRPELTAAKFVTDPASGATLYRTGDMGRELPGGAIEIAGRRDRQVKLRGFRIELEEIERAAVTTGLVDSAFVEKVGEGPSAALIGFTLPSRDTPVPAAELPAALNRQLAERLPSYMLPARWLVLAKLPFGSTGKVDRAGLLALLDPPALSDPPVPLDPPVPAGQGGGEGHPDDPVTDELRGLWRELLGVPDARPGDNFLELGGNSILAMQVVSRIRQRFEVRVEPGTVLLADSLAELAAHVRQLEPAAW